MGQWVEELTGAVLEHGASGFTLFAADHGSPDPVTLGRWALEVAPAVREAVGGEVGGASEGAAGEAAAGQGRDRPQAVRASRR